MQFSKNSSLLKNRGLSSSSDQISHFLGQEPPSSLQPCAPAALRTWWGRGRPTCLTFLILVALNFSTEAVNNIITFLGMQPCERSDKVPENKNSHSLYLAGKRLPSGPGGERPSLPCCFCHPLCNYRKASQNEELILQLSLGYPLGAPSG